MTTIKKLTLFLLLNAVVFSVFAQEKTKVKISTEFGDMIVELHNDTPFHRDNFIKNAQNGWYDGTIFHRVIPQFMAQGGDPNSINATADQSLGIDRCQKIPAEILPHYFHKKGALAAARLPDNMNPERFSSGCQFFIVQGFRHSPDQLANQGKVIPPKQQAWYKAVGGSAFLDGDYTIFGQVIEGLEVLDLISAMPTHKDGGIKDRPVEDVPMTVKIIQ